MLTCRTVEPALHRVLEARPDAVAPARHALAAFARDHGASPQRAADIALVVSEACTNAVVHAYVGAAAPGTVELRAAPADGDLHVRVRDRGRGPAPRPDSPGIGLGLPLMRTLSDGCVVEDADPGTVVRLRFALRQDP
jgi:serine/threonine-protein kinase RsbW